MWVENEAPMKDTLEEIWVSQEAGLKRGLARSRHSRFEYDADPQGKGCPKPANEPSSNRRHQQGFPNTVSKDEECHFLAPGRRWLTY